MPEPFRRNPRGEKLWFGKANFDPPAGFSTAPLRGALDGSVGSANGTLPSQRINRYGLGSGVFSQGVPRALEVGMRLTF